VSPYVNIVSSLMVLMACRVCVGISAKQFIDQAIENGGRVLVHCNGEPLNKGSRSVKEYSYCIGGISLSPAFVVMFVMQHYQLSWEDALHMVQNRRYCISPNGGFLTQIKVFHYKSRHLILIEPTAIDPLLYVK
jgi:serine/threonine/tyrosine-interacting protein